ncbi:MAG: histidine kinase, partial [Deltaproteobacteria bacterium]|nr:histidine kinase [Deltaproteobacteria bacterium]
GESLLGLIGQVLDLSRIESGNVVLKREVSDPREIIERSVSDVLPQSKKRDLDIALEIDEAVLPVNVDKDKIRRVVTNLLGNAVKFSKQGSTIVVRARSCELEDAAQPFDVFEPERNRALEISVTDEGMGIAKDALERIFDSFYQVDNTSTREFGGTGLGLAIVRNFMRAHAGDVEVRSEVGVGTTFTIRLPYNQEEAGTVAGA